MRPIDTPLRAAWDGVGGRRLGGRMTSDGIGRHRAVVTAASTRETIEKSCYSEKVCCEKSVWYTLWCSVQHLVKNLISKHHITKEGVMNTSSSNQNLHSGASSDFANPVTNSALDIFERPSVLIIYERSFDQDIFHHVGSRGPQLDFFCHVRRQKLHWFGPKLFGNGRKVIQPKWKRCCNSRQFIFSNKTIHFFFIRLTICERQIDIQ